MDTDEFLKRCEEIEDGLHELADDLYAVVKHGASDGNADDVVTRCRDKVRRYDELVSSLDDDDREEAESVLGRYIERLRRNLAIFESPE